MRARGPDRAWYDRRLRGGRSLFERQQKAIGEQPEEKQPELFDLHVMMFADGATATAAALERTFAIAPEVAERMVNDVPLVVKRAATPDEAAALIDALQKIGAQVVLLPSTGARADDAAPRRGGEAPRDTWGGLDFSPELSARASIELPPRAKERSSFAMPSFAPHASVLPERPPDAPAATVGVSLAPAPIASDPPRISRFFGDDAAIEPATASSVAAPSPVATIDSELPPALKHEQPDLGLGTVPPLPRVESSPPVVPSAPPHMPPPPPPPRTVAAKPPPVPAAAKRAEPPPVPTRASPSEVELPALQLDDRVRRRAPAAPRARASAAGNDAYWSGRRGQPLPTPTRPTANEPAQNTRDRIAEIPLPEERPVVAVAASESDDEPRSVIVPRLVACASLAAIYLGLQLDNSVFYGNATLPSALLHGLAFYGLFFGLSSFRR